MITLIIILLVLLFVIMKWKPFLDITKIDGDYQIILWYNGNNGERKYINLTGSR